MAQRRERAGDVKEREKEGREQIAFLQNKVGPGGSSGRLCFLLEFCRRARGNM